MIGVNLPCVGFYVRRGLVIPLRVESRLCGILFSQMGNCCAEIVCVISPCAFSQMRNLVSSHKILVCENAGRRLICE